MEIQTRMINGKLRTFSDATLPELFEWILAENEPMSSDALGRLTRLYELAKAGERMRALAAGTEVYEERLAGMSYEERERFALGVALPPEGESG